MDDKNPVSWVLPPDAATAKDRDMDAEDGRQRKKAPTTLQNPYIEMFEDSIRKKTEIFSFVSILMSIKRKKLM